MRKEGYINRSLQSLGDAVGYVARPLILTAAGTLAVLPGCATQETKVKVGYTEPMTDEQLRDLTDQVADEMLLKALGLPDLAVDIGQYLHLKMVETEKAAAATAGSPYIAPSVNLDDWRGRTLEQLEAERANLSPELLTRLDRQWEAFRYVADNTPELRLEAARRASRAAVSAGGKHRGVTQTEIDAQDNTDLPTLWNNLRAPRGP